jgi:hypothetical protein
MRFMTIRCFASERGGREITCSIDITRCPPLSPCHHMAPATGAATFKNGLAVPKAVTIADFLARVRPT